MAIPKFLTHKVAKGVQNNIDLGNKVTLWKTNFNMPFKNIFSNTTNWIPNNGPLNYIGIGTTFDLSGFSYGFEVVDGMVIYRWENNTGGSYTLNADLWARWTDVDNATTIGSWMFAGYHEGHTINAGGWWEVIGGSTIGCAGWEIDQNATYHLRANSLGPDGISLLNTGITFSNVPYTPTLTNKAGYIWVEGNNLCYVNIHSWKHSMVGNLIGFAGLGTKGSLWIDTSNNLHWVGDNGYDYKCTWKVKQFASIYANSATSAVFAGTDKVGCIWIDNEFGGTHLSYIGYDGWKYLTGAGNDPYV